MIKMKSFTDERGGNLLPIEFCELPFVPKRVFTVTDVPKGTIRGEHAHYETKQLLICVKGEIEVYLDNGYQINTFIMKNGDSVFIDRMTWDSQKFLTGDDVMIVLASTNYDMNDYIFDKEEFYKKIINNEFNAN